MSIGIDQVVVAGRRGHLTAPRAAVRAVTSRRGWYWATLELARTDPDATLRVTGLRAEDAAALVSYWNALGLAPRVQSIAREFRALLVRDAYLNYRALSAWKAEAEPLVSLLPPSLVRLPLNEQLLADLHDLRLFVANADHIAARRNDEWVARKQVEHADWFTRTGGSFGLTLEQQDAVLRDEDNCLVIAGAGTGKTATVAAKVGYLLRTGAVKPERLLLLAFTRKAAGEMAERVKATAGSAADQVEVRTFHSLGLGILGRATGVKPSLAKTAGDPLAMADALTGYFRELFEVPATAQEAIDFFAYYLYPYREPFECSTPDEYFRHLRSHGIRTLRGEEVKGYGELTIANWLHLNRIEYRYEAAYEHTTATPGRRQYHPDFHLPEHDIYIEHFGITEDGKTGPGIDAREYGNEMEWKRALHHKWGTRLVETFYHEHRAGQLTPKLEQRLRAYGVVPEPMTASEVLESFNKLRVIEPVARLFVTFLNLFKGNLWTLDDLEHLRHDARSTAFLRIFRHILSKYEAELQAAGEVDVNDMIVTAARAVEERRYRSPFTRVIVDEFQDLSRGRLHLLKALLAQQQDPKLFCVGDDWQSIYRFTGSDVGVMASFERTFGFTKTCYLTQTYRFPSEVLAASSLFVQRNPEQRAKSLKATYSLDSPAIELHEARPGETQEAVLERVLTSIERLEKRTEETRPSVLILGRYRHTQPRYWRSLERHHTMLDLRYLTVHKAKGLEADYTIILDVTAERLGFPTEVADDPLLIMLLPSCSGFPNAEERRLFYVALTRTRRRCFVLTDAEKRSAFIDELEQPEYREWVVPTKAPVRCSAPCPKCSGRLLARTGEYGPFWGCTNYPYCDGRLPTCKACGEGALVRRGGQVECVRAPACTNTAPACPRCDSGMLVLRRGPTGKFLGCSRWPACTATRRID
jgi:DNA helicase IV